MSILHWNVHYYILFTTNMARVHMLLSYNITSRKCLSGAPPSPSESTSWKLWWCQHHLDDLLHSSKCGLAILYLDVVIWLCMCTTICSRYLYLCRLCSRYVPTSYDLILYLKLAMYNTYMKCSDNTMSWALTLLFVSVL